MSPRKLPSDVTWDDLSLEEQVDHLTNECGLTIEEMEPTEEMINDDAVMLELSTKLPEHEHPAWNMATADIWAPEDHPSYSEHYDRVLVTVRGISEIEGQAQLLRQCMQGNFRRVGEMYWSSGRWCVRVRKVEV